MLTFIPLAAIHLPLMLKWLETPHVKKWWDQDVAWTATLVVEKYGSYIDGYKIENGTRKTMRAFIILLDQKPIGYIQCYNVHDFPREDHVSLEDLPTSCAALDLFIGESSKIGQGHGSTALALFMIQHVFPTFDYVFVDPDTANAGAIKSYENAGFRFLKTVSKEKVTWMIRGKSTLHLLEHLEKTLLKPSFNKKPLLIDKFIDDDFEEIGCTGKAYEKKHLLASCATLNTHQLVAKDLRVRELSETFALVTYKTTEQNYNVFRSSLWQDFGHYWGMVFHQATLCSDE